MILKFSVHRRSGDVAPAHLRSRLADLAAWREYYIEFATEPSPAALAGIGEALGDPVLDDVHVNVPIGSGVVQVSYKRGIVDNENDSIVAACHLFGADAVAAKVAMAYGSGDALLSAVIGEFGVNGNIEELHTAEPSYETLLPAGGFASAEQFDLRGLDDVTLGAVGVGNGRQLTVEQMRHVQAIQVAAGVDSVTDVLLEALDARWSDHCAHTTWTSLGKLLKRLIAAANATENPNIISMFHDNAGVWDFFDGQAIAVKAETHNGPSAVSAYFGQLTKIGGVLRDILGTGLGADPIGVFEYTATGDPAGPSPIAERPAPKQVANETIRAVKEYGNTFGVPMMWSHMTFHPAYRAKPFALGGSIGLIPVAAAQRGVPQPGDHLVLIGGLTGNDGIHGASASSAGASAMEATSVQIGAPLEEIKFREAIIDLRDHDCLRAVTDLGAAGLNSAVGEMGDPGGVWLNTALVPLKTSALPMWRILLSESQERMLLAIAPDQLAAARAILDRHDVRTAVVGMFTGNGRYAVVHDTTLTEDDVIAAAAEFRGGTQATPATPATELGFDLAYDLLEWTPEQRPVDPAPPTPAPSHDWSSVVDDVVATAEAVLGDPEVADQSFAALQYDSSVQGRTFYGPLVGRGLGVATNYYASRPILTSRAGVVFSTGFNPWLFDIDPVLAARQAVLAALATQATAGVAVRDVCLCDNFYTPHLAPDSDAWLVAMVDEFARLSVQLRTPFISGKDSSAGSTATDEGMVSVPPAVFVSALGKIADVARLRPEPWANVGHAVVLVGPRTAGIAGTVAGRVAGHMGSGVDDVDVAAANSFLHAMATVPLDLAACGRTVGAGGVIAAAFASTEASGLGVAFATDDEAALFAEHRCGALLEVHPDRVGELPVELNAVILGAVTDSGEIAVGDQLLTTPAARTAWSTSFREALR